MRVNNLLDENLQLWNDFRKGDADAFGELMRVHYRDMFNYGTRISQDEELVKDCIQELFLALWKNRLTINETSFVKYYLLKSLRRRLVKNLKKTRFYGLNTELHFDAGFAVIPSIENIIINRENLSELSQKMREILLNLSKRQQEVIYLRFYMNADVEEIAEIMNLNRQSVYNLLHDALKKLKMLSRQTSFSLSAFLSFCIFASLLKF